MAVPLFIVLAAASATGCFALFSLDDYGPPGPPIRDGEVVGRLDAEAGPVSTPEAAPPVDVRPVKRVFLTSTTSNGNLNGTKGADATCQTLAAAAGLSGTFRAWLTVDKDTPPARFFGQPDRAADASVPDVRLVDTTGRTVALSWTQLLTTKAPLVPIEHTERGTKLNSADAGVKSNDQGVTCGSPGNGATFLPVWTNTKGDGTVNDFDVDCQNFMDNNTTGRIGIVASDAGWTDFNCAYPCELKARLYCFEQ